MKSSTLTYGPWKNVGANPGGVQCDLDEGLTPWEYGGIYYMNAAATQKVMNNITKSQWAERGEVTVPGYPTRLLGSCLTLKTQDVKTRFAEKFDSRVRTSTSTSYERRIIESYKVVFSSLDKQQASASISNINVSIGSNGVTTSYQISTFTPVYGRFSKGNADRIKQIGLNRLKGEREMRARNQLKRLLSGGAGHLGSAGRWGFRSSVDSIGKGSIAPKSPMVLYVGKVAGWELPYPTGTGMRAPDFTGIPLSNAAAGVGSYQYLRKAVLGATSTTLAHYKNYEGTSMMTMDGFMRPVTNRHARTGPFFGTGVAGSWPIEGTYTNKRYHATTQYWWNGFIADYNGQEISGPLPPRAFGQNYIENASDDDYRRGQAGGWFGSDGVIPTPLSEDVGTGVGQIGRYPMVQKTQTIAPFPPISGYESLEISTWYLDFLADPVSNPFLINDLRATGILGGWWCGTWNCCDSDRFGRGNCTPPFGTGSMNGAAGHDIEGVARSGFTQLVNGSTTGSLLFRPDWDPIGHGKPTVFPNDPANSDPQEIDYPTNYRYLAMRGPIMLQSWGYDIQGHPIPNEFDIRNPESCCWGPVPENTCPEYAWKNLPYLCFGAAQGEFQTDYAKVSDKFMDNWLQRSDSWPVAPVDLRFDRKRGVWTIPPSFRLLQVKTTGIIDPGATDTATVEKWIYDMDSPDYTIGTGTGEGMEHELTGQKFSGPKGTSGPTEGKHVIQLENWSESALQGKVLAYYDTAEGKYWAVQKVENGIPAVYVGCASKEGSAGTQNGCYVGNNVNESTVLGKFIREDGGEEREGITTLILGCGIRGIVTPDWGTHHIDWYGSNEALYVAPGSMKLAGLEVQGGLNDQDPAPAEKLIFSDKLKISEYIPPDDSAQWHTCTWSVDLAGDLGGCQSGINAVVKYVESVKCVGASFEVCSKNMEFYSGCLVATSDQPANKINM